MIYDQTPYSSPANGSVLTEMPRCTVPLKLARSAKALTIVFWASSATPSKTGWAGLATVNRVKVTTGYGFTLEFERD